MSFLHLFILLFLYTFGPGLLLVRPLRLPPRERLVVAIGVGLFLNYVVGFILFANGWMLDLGPTFLTLGCVVLGVAALNDWRTLLRSRQVRRLLLCWLVLLVFGLVLLSMIRNYGGGTWGGDWREHYQRSSFFFGIFDYDFKFIDQYPLPMRPPMMNVLTASLLAQAAAPEQMMEAFQVSFLFLNSLVFLPLAILIPRLIRLPPRLARKATWTLAAILAASPMFDQNLTYAWTKLFAAYYALAGIAIYLRCWRRSANPRTVFRFSAGAVAPADRKEKLGRLDYQPPPGPIARDVVPITARPSAIGFPLAFALLCIGFLVHFSVGPYGLFLGLHYLAAVWWKRPNRWCEAVLIGAVSALVFATWFPWSIAHYGSKTTFTSTSAVSDSVKMTPAENIANVARNMGNTLVPTIVQKPGLIWADNVADRDIDLDQPGFAGRLRDFTFLIYQVSLPGGLGSVGWVLAFLLLVRAINGTDLTDKPVRGFWIAFIPIVFLAGVAVYGGLDRFGVAHICLQPMILIGLALLAGGVWRMSAAVRMVLLAGLLLDFSLGVMLQMTLQHDLPQIEVIAGTHADGTPVIVHKIIETPDTPSRAAQNNAGDRLRMSIDSSRDFWGDRFRDGGLPPLQCVAGAMMAFLLFAGFAPAAVRTAYPLAARLPVPDRRPRSRKRQRR